MEKQDLLDEYHTICQQYRDTRDRYYAENGANLLNCHAYSKKLRIASREIEYELGLWFQSLCEEDQMTLVRASVDDVNLYNSLNEFWTDSHTNYYVLIQ